MNNELDALLQDDLLSVPDDFNARIMREIQQLPIPMPRKSWRNKLQWLAISGAAALGIAELFSFMFGIWMSSQAY